MAAYSQSAVKVSDRGSTPWLARSGWLSAISGGPGCQSTTPKRRGSAKRRICVGRSRSKWSCFSGGKSGGTKRRLPDMPRWMISVPSTPALPQSINRYLARRRTATIRQPGSNSLNSRGISWRNFGARIVTPTIGSPTSSGATPRRQTSTSGNSGIACPSGQTPITSQTNRILCVPTHIARTKPD